MGPILNTIRALAVPVLGGMVAGAGLGYGATRLMNRAIRKEAQKQPQPSKPRVVETPAQAA